MDIRRLFEVIRNAIFESNRNDILKLLSPDSIVLELGIFRKEFSNEITKP